jgi:hypothetical protein
MISRVTFICLAFFCAQVLFPQPSPRRPGREIALPPEQVKDTFFAYVIGVIASGTDLEMTNEDLRDILTEFKTNLNLPFDLIRGVVQHTDEQSGECSMSIAFNGDAKIPIPFSLLGYHPGSILATSQLHFTQTRPVSSREDEPVTANPVYVMHLTEGQIVVDVDDWLISLLPSMLDDLSVRFIAIFHYKEDWYCQLGGTGRRAKKGLNWFFSLTGNRIIYPIPKELARLGRRIAKEDPFSF